MKKKIVELLLALTTLTAAFTGCGSKNTTAYANETIQGEISEIGDDFITIALTKQEGLSTEELTKGERKEPTFQKTGETCQIKISSDTVIKRQQMGGGSMMEPPGGQDSSIPEKPDEMPDGEMPDGENTPQMPDGEKPTMPDVEIPDGEMPEMPDGEMPDSENAPQMPDSNNAQEISLSDLAAGDIVSVTFDENGNVTEILVSSMPTDKDLPDQKNQDTDPLT